MEVLTLNGDITIFNDQHKIHAHVVLGKEDGTAHGGHLIKAIVHPTLEIILNESPVYLERQMNEELGISLIKI
jgi:predicted DNA-binding protein with PD1-like motif